MDITGVILGVVAALVCAKWSVAATGTYRLVRRLRRAGHRIHGTVTGVDLSRGPNYRVMVRKPEVSYRIDNRTYRSVVENYRGAPPVDTYLDVLVDPDAPSCAAVADRGDAGRQLMLSLALTMACVAEVVWAFTR